MKKNIAVIGCGQLGCRHIQGLGVSNLQLVVHVFDKSQISVDKCRKFIDEIGNELKNVSLSYYHSLEELGHSVDVYDLAIVASTAHDRPRQMISILSKLDARHWILEKPISQSTKELDQLAATLSGQNVYINHFRRVLPWHQELRARYFAGKQVEMVIAGADLGIGCNVSHFVDLVNYWSDEVPVNVDVAGLHKYWHESKRRPFKEINGELVMAFSKGSSLKVVSNDDLGGFSIVGKLQESDCEFLIDENNAIAFVGDNDPLSGAMLYQSQITGKVFDQLEYAGVCALTPLDVAVDCYRPIVEALLSHWNSTADGSGDLVVPLT